MKISIHTRLLIICISLILITVIAISGCFFILIKQEKQRESLERIQIGFDVVSDDFTNRLQNYTQEFEDFLKHEIDLQRVTDSYNQDKKILRSPDYIVTKLAKIAEGIKNFGLIIRADQLTLYTQDKRLLILFQRLKENESIGSYVETEIEGQKKDTYISMDDFSKLSSLFFGDKPIPYVSLPKGVDAKYKGEIPDHISAGLFTKNQQIGIRIIAPLFHDENKTAVLVGEIFLTQAMVERYAKLSKMHLNIFTHNQFCLGTLSALKDLKSCDLEHIQTWDEILDKKKGIEILPIRVDGHDFYQGSVALKSGQNIIGAITISISQEMEKKEINNILMSILVISIIMISLGFFFFFLSTRKSVHFFQKIINYIDRMSKGDIPDKINEKYNGELEHVKNNLNRLIDATNETSRIAEEIVTGNLRDEIINRSEHDRLMKALNSLNTDLKKLFDEKIVELIQSQEALQESKEKLHIIIDTSPVGICTVDLHGNFVMTNMAYEQMLGYSKEELRGLCFFDVTHPDYRPKNKKLFQDMFSLKTASFTMEKKYVRKDGLVIEVVVHATGIVDAEGNNIFGTAFVEDITERKIAEQELEKHRNHLKKLVDEKTSELQKTINLMVGREIRMSELKEIIRQLNKQIEDAGMKPIKTDPLLKS